MRRWWLICAGGSILLLALGALALQLPSLAANGILRPARHSAAGPPPPTCDDATFEGEGVPLRGWRCGTSGVRRGTLVYLHGIGDNRASGSGIIDRFGRRGLDVLAYDSRAHGESGGDACTYGFYETRDLSRVLNTVTSGPIVLLGASLGAAVALQAAAVDTRIGGVVAAEAFSDLRTVVRERAPFLVRPVLVSPAIHIAEELGRFEADLVSPVLAAAHITAPVLLIHGAADVHTSPDHSHRILAALQGPKRLILVPGARHNESLRGDAWDAVERWIDELLGTGAGGT